MAASVCQHPPPIHPLASLDHSNRSSYHYYSNVNPRLINKQADKCVHVRQKVQYRSKGSATSWLRTKHLSLHDSCLAHSQTLHRQNLIIRNRLRVLNRQILQWSQQHPLRMELHLIRIHRHFWYLAHVQHPKLYSRKPNHQSIKRQRQHVQRIRAQISRTTLPPFQSHSFPS